MTGIRGSASRFAFFSAVIDPPPPELSPSSDGEIDRESSESHSPSRRALNFSLAVAVAVVIASVGLLMPLPGPERVKNALADLLHFPSFFVLTFILLVVAARTFSSRSSVALGIAVAVIFVSAVLEWAQHFVGRSSSVHDLIANTLGAFAAWAVHAHQRVARSQRYVIYFLCVGMIWFVSYGPMRLMLDIYRELRYPARVGFFDDRYELNRWYFHAARKRVRLEPDAAEHGNTLCLRFMPNEYPAAQLQELTRDWTSYRLLRFRMGRPALPSVTAPDGERTQVRMVIRDFVRHHASAEQSSGDNETDNEPYAYYTTLLSLKPGDSQIVEIPIREIEAASGDLALDLQCIRFIEFTALDLKQPVDVELRAIELVK